MAASAPDAPEIPTLLDEQILADLYEDFASTGDLAELAALIRGFLERGAAQIDRIGAAIEVGDAEAVRIASHKMKGSSRTLGANLAGAVAAAIEAAGDAGDVLAAKRLLPELRITFTLSRSVLLDATEAIDGGDCPGPVAPVADSRGLTVLIADDEPIALGVLRAGIERLGHDCTVVTDGFAALSAYESAAPSVVVTDWQMPGLDGLALARRIRAMAGGEAPYIVLLSASGDHAEARTEIGPTVDAVLSKPVREDELRAVLALAAKRTS